MDIYEVGGAVRDALLDLPVKDRDWVVVGGTAQAMDAAGYRQVGRDFPVFLHPQSGEEYALARTERKSGKGHTGFVVHASPDVTLEEDLQRRDLTINAMARAADGTLVDPFGGRQDLQARWLRHVSPAFREDPLRVLRVARFAARFAHLGFRVAPETLALMREMCGAGELQHLTAERVWQECERALQTDSPAVFFQVLQDCDAFALLFPELPLPAQTLSAALQALQRAGVLSAAGDVRLAAFLAVAAPLEAVETLCRRLRLPNRYRDLALLVARHAAHAAAATSLDAATLLELIEALDALRRPERFALCLLACEAVANAHVGKQPWPAAQRLQQVRTAAAAVDAAGLAARCSDSRELPALLRQARLQAIAACMRITAPGD